MVEVIQFVLSFLGLVFIAVLSYVAWIGYCMDDGIDDELRREGLELQRDSKVVVHGCFYCGGELPVNTFSYCSDECLWNDHTS